MTSSQYLAAPPAWSEPWPPLAGLYLETPHSDTMFEALGSGGFALGVIGLCLLVGARSGWGGTQGTHGGAEGGAARQAARRVALVVTAPLAAVGAMALTVYSAQIVVIWWWTLTGVDLLSYPDNGPLGLMVLYTLAGATLWRALFGSGPLERVFAGIARKTFPTPERVQDAGPDIEPGAGTGTGHDVGPDAAPGPTSEQTSEPRAQNAT
jgi:hypothetical protein